MGAVQQFELPVTNHLTENGSAAAAREVLRAGRRAARRGRRHESARARLGKELDVFFDNNPVFKLAAEAAGKGPARASRGSPSPAPLRSGWAWGQQYLDKGVEIVETNVGKGRVFLLGTGDALPVAAARQLQVLLQRVVPVGRADADRTVSRV